MSLTEWFLYQWRKERRDIEKTDMRLSIPWPAPKPDRRKSTPKEKR